MDFNQFLNIDTILFDLDGTLLNTLEDLADSVNFVLEKYNCQTRSLEEIRCFVGNGITRLIELSLPSGSSQELLKTCLTEFRSYYPEHMQIKTTPYNGILPLLKELKEKGFHLGIVSNKLDTAVKGLCKHYFFPYIDTAMGETDDLAKKPAPDMLYRALKRMRADTSRTIYVGDSNVDLDTAHNASLPCISVTWGFRSREELIEAGASILVSSTEEFRALFPALVQ